MHPPLHRNSGQTDAEPVSLAICESSNSTCRLQALADCKKDDVCRSDFTIIIFPFFALLIGVIVMPTARKVKIPYTLFLLIIGIILGAIGCAADLGLLSISLQQWVHLNPPTAFFYVFLAPLIFEASFNTRWHVFKRLLLPILTAAFVIVIMQVGLIAAFQKLVIRTAGWSWWAALMFGAMLSATDPISVTATLKSLGASEFLNTLIEGESLVNDGSAFVLWEAFFENTVEEGSLSIGEIVVDIFRLSLGGMLMGVAFGIGALIILGLLYDEFEVETSITVIVAFLGFWTAQAPSRLSGVICNVASGLVISAFGRHLITPAVREPLAEFWELLSWIANTIVFVHAGVLLTAFTWSCAGEPNGYEDYLFILAYYVFLQVIRMGLILIFRPVMAIGNQWFQWKEAVVVGFSGLRGAVSLILALEVAGAQINSEVKSRVVLWTTGVVALSLLVNGFLIKPLIQYLKLDKAKKSREDFLHRARAIMVQRSLQILDILCIEAGFKSARWSYVVKNSLPAEWLHEQEHAAGYRGAVEQLMDNVTVSRRKSLEHVTKERKQRIFHSQVNRRISTDILSMQTTPTYTPRSSAFRQPVPVAGSPLFMSPRESSPVAESVPFQANTFESPLHVAPLSLGAAAVGDLGYSFEGTNRLSIDADLARYRPNATKPAQLTQAKIHQDVAELHEKMMAGQSYDFTEEDREVQRRLLTAILSHVRALSNASLVEFNVLHNLEEDCQRALDANDEGRDYDLFSFLDNRGRQRSKKFYKAYLRIVEGRKLQGVSSITTAVVVFGILTEILKEEILHSSPIVQLQAEQLYEGSAALLNRLEALNPFAFEWVESQFAVYVSANKQDEVLEEMLESGIVDAQEFGVIHHELIEVRRNHVQSRHSFLHWGRERLPPKLKPRALIRKHPLFANLSPELLANVVDSFGELVHLKSGQTLQADRGSLVVVLAGAIRPMDDNVLPPKTASRLKKSNAELSVAITDVHSAPASPQPRSYENKTDSAGNQSLSQRNKSRMPGLTPLASGATMHWCFPAHNGFCGNTVTLHAHNKEDGEPCAIAEDRAIDTEFCCCEIAGSATVFTLPVAQVRQLAKESEEFKMEITKSLAREIVLESVADQRPYSLSRFMQSISSDTDVNTVVGRAFRVLERLPYMTVVDLRAGELSTRHVQGPGVLLNGTVRVSIVDTSGLSGAVNLLHEELTGPALLPAGGLILEEVHKRSNPDVLKAKFEDIEVARPLTSGTATEASEAATNLLNLCEAKNEQSVKGKSPVLAHVLIEEVSDDDQTAVRRLQRWTGLDAQIDMNGRFGMYRHVELAPFVETKIQ